MCLSLCKKYQEKLNEKWYQLCTVQENLEKLGRDEVGGGGGVEEGSNFSFFNCTGFLLALSCPGVFCSVRLK